MEQNEPWSVYVVGQMHRYRISSSELAGTCGYSLPYLSAVLNGKREFANKDAKSKTKRKICNALRILIATRMEEAKDGD